MKLPRIDSLFARLLLLQVGVAVTLLLLFGLFVYVDRNMAVARLVGRVPFVMLDEPTYGLDDRNRASLLDRMKKGA